MKADKFCLWALVHTSAKGQITVSSDDVHTNKADAEDALRDARNGLSDFCDDDIDGLSIRKLVLAPVEIPKKKVAKKNVHVNSGDVMKRLREWQKKNPIPGIDCTCNHCNRRAF